MYIYICIYICICICIYIHIYIIYTYIYICIDTYYPPEAETLDFLEDQRTNIKLAYGIEAKLGHMPQEDYPAAINDTMVEFFLQE